MRGKTNRTVRTVRTVKTSSDGSVSAGTEQNGQPYYRLTALFSSAEPGD